MTDKEEICHCAGTTKNEIITLINEGFDNLEKLSRMTGACSGCGACETEISELIACVNRLPGKQLDEGVYKTNVR